MNKTICNLSVDVEQQENGLFDAYIANDGDSGCHYKDVTADKIGELVAEEILTRRDRDIDRRFFQRH